MSKSFASRIVTYFATLFLFAMSALFALWFFGLPAVGLQGASSQKLNEAMRVLELSANHLREVLDANIAERRGDMLVIAENRLLAENIAQGKTHLRNNFERVVERTQRAYPDRFRSLQLIDPVNGNILAAIAESLDKKVEVSLTLSK